MERWSDERRSPARLEFGVCGFGILFFPHPGPLPRKGQGEGAPPQHSSTPPLQHSATPLLYLSAPFVSLRLALDPPSLLRMVRLVLFDIDGTLIRTGGAGVKAFAKVFAAEFDATDGFERLKFSGRTDVSLVREFFSFHQIEPTQQNFKRFFERYVFWLD